ncbi:MAG: FAD:protein FMN transferase [Synergistaceae bacterium]
MKHKNIKKVLSTLLTLFVFAFLGTLLFKPKPITVSSESYKLGTIIKITAYGRDKAKLEKAIADAEEEISRYEDLLSVNIKTSEVSKINRYYAIKTKVSQETLDILNYSLEMARKTDGHFDPTIAPIVTLWGIGTDHPKVPTKKEIANLLPYVNHKTIEITSDGYVKKVLGQEIDLGAVAKGWIADKIAEELREDDINSAIIDLGGNLFVVGRRPNMMLWRLGLQHPAEARGKHFGIVKVSDQSVVTSGSYERFFEKDGVRYHHIFDTKTGYPANSDLSSVTIISKSSAEADALCTALYSMGSEKAWDFLMKHKDIKAILFSKDYKKIYITKAAKKIFYLEDRRIELETIEEDNGK